MTVSSNQLKVANLNFLIPYTPYHMYNNTKIEICMLQHFKQYFNYRFNYIGL